jgi:hypothetical protein
LALLAVLALVEVPLARSGDRPPAARAPRSVIAATRNQAS